MIIFVVNCGSSSVKYQLIEMTTETPLASGIVEEVGLATPRMTHKRPGHKKLEWEAADVKDHRSAIQAIFAALQDRDHGVIGDMSELDAVGHRVVHGGENFASSIRIDAKVLNALYENIELAPLHNPANIQGIEAISSLLPDIPQVAVFDTAFHQTMSPEAFLCSSCKSRWLDRYRHTGCP